MLQAVLGARLLKAFYKKTVLSVCSVFCSSTTRLCYSSFSLSLVMGTIRTHSVSHRLYIELRVTDSMSLLQEPIQLDESC